MNTTGGPFSERTTPRVFLIVTVLHTFHPCKWLDIVVCSKDCLIADLSDHVFYGGCRLMYRPISRLTVDKSAAMSVEIRSSIA